MYKRHQSRITLENLFHVMLSDFCVENPLTFLDLFFVCNLKIDERYKIKNSFPLPYIDFCASVFMCTDKVN